jgi:hypothetical protein
VQNRCISAILSYAEKPCDFSKSAEFQSWHTA